MVDGLTSTPVAAAHSAQCSTSVASGAARTWATRAVSRTAVDAPGAAGARGRPHGAGLLLPRPPALDRTDPNAKETGRLGLGEPGVDGSQQPLTEVGGVLLHSPSSPIRPTFAQAALR